MYVICLSVWLLFIYPFSIFPRTNIQVRCRPFGTWSACLGRKFKYCRRENRATRHRMDARSKQNAHHVLERKVFDHKLRVVSKNTVSISRSTISEFQCRIVLSIQQPFPTAIRLIFFISRLRQLTTKRPRKEMRKNQTLPSHEVGTWRWENTLPKRAHVRWKNHKQPSLYEEWIHRTCPQRLKGNMWTHRTYSHRIWRNTGGAQ